MTADVAEVLDKAAKLIEERGWTQGAYERQDGTCCIVGAIDAASNGVNYVRAYSAVRDVVGTERLSGWNDQTGRTKTEVLVALRAAADAERSS